MKNKNRNGKVKEILNIFKFILFISYTVLVFFINDFIYLLIPLFINISCIVILKIKKNNFTLLDMFKNLLKLSLLILLTVIVNFIIESFEYALLVAIKLLLICNITYIFSKSISYMEFAKVIEDIFYPLKIFKVEPKNIGIIISIALAFIPILKKELEDLKYLLKIKGFKISFINILKNISLVSKPFFVSILRKVNDLENTLLIKGYFQEN